MIDERLANCFGYVERQHFDAKHHRILEGYLDCYLVVPATDTSFKYAFLCYYIVDACGVVMKDRSKGTTGYRDAELYEYILKKFPDELL
jgi:hypothetical protein